MMKNPKTTVQILAAMLIVTMVAFIRSAYQNGKLQADLNRQTENVGSLTYDIQYGNLDDSLSVAKNTALQAKCDELKRLHLADTHQLYTVKCRKASAGSQLDSRLLGTDHPHVLAADRLHDDHIYCRTSECS